MSSPHEQRHVSIRVYTHDLRPWLRRGGQPLHGLPVIALWHAFQAAIHLLQALLTARLHLLEQDLHLHLLCLALLPLPQTKAKSYKSNQQCQPA